ncbi:MAG: NAD(P)/FAD-dependent oxidoreductase [Dehalococcoidales bacterium]|nr:NAD(P)/FAD-dependent oxidoreductase [Dehalococcoidales bacterium]
MSDMADITIIGAGVVGLAVAAQIASKDKDIYVLEKNERFGMETSSRHSEVIHSGIYYPQGSLKAKTCLAGNRILYDLCKKHGIGYKRLGKLIVAIRNEEVKELYTLLEKGKRNGINDLRLLSKQEINELEPNVEGIAAILSPSTGIIDSHALMQHFITQAMYESTQIIYQTKVIGIEKITDGYKVTVEDSTGISNFNTRILINCAGLYCDEVAELAGIDITKAGYRLHYCKGEFFSVTSNKSKLVERLIYPVPPPQVTGVGIHITFDLEGRMRLGPSIQYVYNIDYSVSNQNKQLFYDSVKTFLPFIEYDDLEPEMAGIRPKLQGPGEDIKDFIIRDESDKGLPGFINLIGIESPGLTASPAIAVYVSQLIEELLNK